MWRPIKLYNTRIRFLTNWCILGVINLLLIWTSIHLRVVWFEMHKNVVFGLNFKKHSKFLVFFVKYVPGAVCAPPNTPAIHDRHCIRDGLFELTGIFAQRSGCSELHVSLSLARGRRRLKIKRSMSLLNIVCIWAVTNQKVQNHQLRSFGTKSPKCVRIF